MVYALPSLRYCLIMSTTCSFVQREHGDERKEWWRIYMRQRVYRYVFCILQKIRFHRLTYTLNHSPTARLLFLLVVGCSRQQLKLWLCVFYFLPHEVTHRPNAITIFARDDAPVIIRNFISHRHHSSVWFAFRAAHHLNMFPWIRNCAIEILYNCFCTNSNIKWFVYSLNSLNSRTKSFWNRESRFSRDTNPMSIGFAQFLLVNGSPAHNISIWNIQYFVWIIFL